MLETFRDYLAFLILDHDVPHIEDTTDTFVFDLLSVFSTSLPRGRDVLPTPSCNHQQKLLILCTVRRQLSESERELPGAIKRRRRLTETQIKDLAEQLSGCRQAIRMITLGMNTCVARIPGPLGHMEEVFHRA